MTGRTIQCTISSDLVATRPDALLSDCLRIETTSKIILHPGGEARVNLSVHNSSSEGRMGQVIANYDPRQVSVKIPTSGVYVAPGGKTAIYAIIIPVTPAGQAAVTFDVF